MKVLCLKTNGSTSIHHKGVKSMHKHAFRIVKSEPSVSRFTRAAFARIFFGFCGFNPYLALVYNNGQVVSMGIEQTLNEDECWFQAKGQAAHSCSSRQNAYRPVLNAITAHASADNS